MEHSNLDMERINATQRTYAGSVFTKLGLGFTTDADYMLAAKILSLYTVSIVFSLVVLIISATSRVSGMFVQYLIIFYACALYRVHMILY